MVGGPGGDTSGALAGEDGGRAGGKGGGRAGGKGGGGGGGMLGRGRTVAATPCASEASPSLGDAEGLNGPLIVLVGSRGEGAREPGPCPVLPPAASLWPAGRNTGKPPANRSPRAGGVLPPREFAGPPPSLLVPLELSICGALRSLICVTFRRRVPCWISANSALRPLGSVFLKLEASVLTGGADGGGGGGRGGSGGGSGICHSVGVSFLGMVPGEWSLLCRWSCRGQDRIRLWPTSPPPPPPLGSGLCPAASVLQATPLGPSCVGCCAR